MPRIPANQWRPHGISEMEDAAWEALRHNGSCSVVAGPGAGKTEFLAQKVAYLLETGACPPQQRILAISFKTDAARNLAERVALRCPPHLARRFTSTTFDAFTKGLVDRFTLGIPERWRPRRGYTPLLPTRNIISTFLEGARRAAPLEWRDGVGAIRGDTFERVANRTHMPMSDEAPSSAQAFAVEQWWRVQLDGDTPRLTFGTINRLAELLLRTRPHIRRALRASYPHVLIDEFQDTTYTQYEVLTTAFDSDSTSITAVGDLKQGIMRWAGAMDASFDRFDAMFGARRLHLVQNHRSSPGLVRIQHVIAQRLDPTVGLTVATTDQHVEGDVAQVWHSAHMADEVRYLADWIVEDQGRRGLAPRDYAVLVRQKATAYADQLTPALGSVGLSLRNESHALVPDGILLQDLMADDFARAAVGILRLGAVRNAPASWSLATRTVHALSVFDPEDAVASRRADIRLQTFAKQVHVWMGNQPTSGGAAHELSARVFTFLDRDAIGRFSPAHGRGGYLPKVEEAFSAHLAASTHGARTWEEVLDAYDGIHDIPLMTVHKSKGLEFDTIILLGLDDDGWWSHSADDPQTSTLFVALSRAKQRAIFSFCAERGARQKVADLYRLLTDAGVEETVIGG